MATNLLLRNGGLLMRLRLPPAAARYVPARKNTQHRVVLVPEVPDDTDKTNPILKKVTDGLPDFSKVTDPNIYFGLGKALMEFEAAVSKLEEKCEGEERDFGMLFSDLERAKCQFECVWGSANLLQLTTDGLDKDRFTRLHLRAEKAEMAKFQSAVIYGAMKEMKIKNAEGKGFLGEDEERILDRWLMEFKHQGFELTKAKFSELTETWSPRLMEAKAEYKFRIGITTEQFKHTIRDPNVVSDFPIDVLTAMASDSSQPTKGPWTVTLHPYVYKQVMAYCPDRNVRWTTHRADVTRGEKTVDTYTQVVSQVKLIRQHRSDQAITLGYNNFAELSMDTKMASNVENVHTMISAMLKKAKPHQEAELESLQSYAEARGFDDDIEVFDVEYFRRKQKRSLLGTSDEDLRDYFPLPKVLRGIFELCSSLFCVQFEQVKGQESTFWHPDVLLFRAVDASPGTGNKVLGEFYLDPYIRDDKGYGGGDKGWYIPIRHGSRIANCRPLGAMVMSLPAPNYGKPSLLNFAETEELLRNFGNLLYHMCSASGDWSDLTSRTGLEWDVLDVPGYFATNWLYTPEVLRLLSGHWSTDRPLDPETLAKLCSVPRQLMAGYSLCQELYHAACDIAFYSEDHSKESSQELGARLRSDYLLLPAIDGDVYPQYMTNMMSGEYPAAVFTSTWAKMLAADAFSAVQEVMTDSGPSFIDNEEVRKVTMRFRKTMLEMGSSRPSAEIFRRFRGRDPSHEALLLNLGLKAPPHPSRKAQELP